MMKNKERSVREYLNAFDEGKFDSANVKVQCEAGWYDWFCKDSSLVNKTKKLTAKLKSIARSSRIDLDNNYVFFKNNCPCKGPLYDDFRICDIKTGDVLFTITPKSGHSGKAEVHGKENDFKEPLAFGKWKDVQGYFMEWRSK